MSGWDGRGPGVVVLAELPPPVDGMTAVTARVVDLLRERGELATVLRGTRGRSRRAGVRRAVRAATLLAQAPRLAVWRARGCRRLYLPSDSTTAGLARVLVTVAWARLLGMSVVLHHHVFTYVDEHSPAMQAICRVGGRRLDHVVLCDVMRDRFHRRYAPRGSTTVVSNLAVVPLDEPPPLERGGGPLRVGLFGNLTAVKGVPALLELAARFAGDGRVELHAAGPVGDDVAASIEAAVRRGELTVHGPRYGDEKVAFLAGLDLLLFPSTYAAEAEPMVVWEAVALGVPVVAYRRGCIECQLPPQHLVDSGDVDGLARWVAEFARDPAPARSAAVRLRDGLAGRAAAARERLHQAVATGA